jgi:hypothetical protein
LASDSILGVSSRMATRYLSSRPSGETTSDVCCYLVTGQAM